VMVIALSGHADTHAPHKTQVSWSIMIAPVISFTVRASCGQLFTQSRSEHC